MWAIYDINYFLTRVTLIPTAIAGAGVTQAVFYMLVYVGILPFCMRWGLLRKEEQANGLEKNRRHLRQSPAEMEANSVPSHILEAHSRMVVEAGEAKEIMEADTSRPVFEADSKALGEDSKEYTGDKKCAEGFERSSEF